MTEAQAPQTEPLDLEEWKPYEIDHLAQQLVVKNRDKKDVLNESHKMRMAVAYGLERFWGERFRLEKDEKEKEKADYWKAVWKTLADEILKPVGINLPNDEIKSDKTDKKEKEKEETKKIENMADRIWRMPQDDREIALTVLAQFCDSLVWWTQRYKKKS